jgi:predicted transcriptional regulator
LLRVIFAWNVLIHRLQRTFRRKLQTAVSQNRRRFYDADGDFNLDLTYICDRLIAMSLNVALAADSADLLLFHDS